MSNAKDQAQQAAHQAKQDIRNDQDRVNDETGKKNALADVPPEFSVNNRDSDLDKDSSVDPTDAGYDEAVKHDPAGGFEVADVDDMLETERENAIGGVPTLTPSPTARDDEDPTALDESNVAGEAHTQNM